MNKYMKKAIDQAMSGIKNNEGGPFGTVIVKDGKIVGEGHNEVVKRHDPTCHGEMMAIRNACENLGTFDLSGCELYTTGEPCVMCRGAIMWANIDKVYFGCDTTDAEDIGFRDKKFAAEVSGNASNGEQIDREECKELFNTYKKINNKTEY